MSILVGRISYMPQDEKIRAKRLEASRFQYEWLCEVLPNEKKVERLSSVRER